MQKVIILLLVISPFIIFAQDGPNFPGVPIDGGLSVLLGAGVLYGAKKAFDANKDNEK